MKAATLLLIVLSTAGSFAGQSPAQRPDQPAHIRGRVVSADDGRPLVRARVSLLSASTPGRPLMATSTNAQGNYDLGDVPPGSYFVSASRAGYLELQYGQRRARERGLSVDVKAGATIDRIDISLARGGVLAGRVVDELGEPYPGLLVTAGQLRYQQGRRVPFPSGTGRTDDQGAYRISGLPPGAYTLSALSPETWRNEKNETLGYAATYYPGTSADQAQSIVLEAGQHRTTLDIALTAARTARLRGRIARPTGEPAAGESVSLAPSIRGSTLTIVVGNPITTKSGADGSFEMVDVPPGYYNLRASIGRNESDSISVDVSGDLDNLLLVPRSGSTVTGVVVTDTGEPPPFTASGARLLLLAPGERVLPTVRVPAINADWTFTLNNLGGPFLFRLSGFPDDWILDSVRLNDEDLTDVPFDVPTGQRQISGLRIAITKDAGRIAGTVATPKGTPTADAFVVAFPEDERHWMFGSRFVRTARPTTEGNYVISGLPQGEYLLVAEPELMEGEWESREYLKRASSRATRATLSRGESITVDLTVSP
jgi:protocatechuate 3,4-dioxygenase beta subunit